MTATPAQEIVVVTGANGLVGRSVCDALSAKGVTVRALVRRPGSAPQLEGVTEHVGDFDDADVASRVTAGATAVVTTVHPLGADGAEQRRVAVAGTPTFVRAARDQGVRRAVHVSTAAVYDRSPSAGDVGESSPLVDDGAGDYAVTKRDTDAALRGIDGITTILVRPPAILGAGSTSVWNTIRPRMIAEDPAERREVPDKTFAWIHVTDLARIIAELAVGDLGTTDAPATGPVAGACTAVNVAAPPATVRDYLMTVAEAVGVTPEWLDEPAWTGRLLTDRAHAWGWAPRVSLAEALDELAAGLVDRDS